jgi:hypothetical protein
MRKKVAHSAASQGSVLVRSLILRDYRIHILLKYQVGLKTPPPVGLQSIYRDTERYKQTIAGYYLYCFGMHTISIKCTI